MHDPRTPEILAWVEAMPIAERADRHARYEFRLPILKNDRGWTAKVSAVLVELKPTKRKHEDILIEAAQMSGRLKRELARQ
jgi:hypothetical protein